MFKSKLPHAALASACLMTLLPLGNGDTRYRDLVQLQQLASDFHGAGAKGDVALMRSIWAEDAVFRGGPNLVRGRDDIVEFFRRGAGWGKTANLTSSYKSTYDIKGNKATIRFECIIVNVKGSSPLTTSLSSLPPATQNPNVEIVQHSNTTVEAVRKHDRWIIQNFTGQGGAIQ